MASPWDKDEQRRLLERLAEIVNAGPRGGGVENALGKRFDAGSANAAQLAREIDHLENMETAMYNFLDSGIVTSGDDRRILLEKAKGFALQLSLLRASDKALKAKEHARQHPEAQGEEGVVVHEDLRERREMGGLEGMPSKLPSESAEKSGTSSGLSVEDLRPTLREVRDRELAGRWGVGDTQ